MKACNKTGIELELIENLARWREFVPEWRKLLDEVPPPTPFQTPEWLLTWWLHFGSGKLQVLVFRSEGRAVGVLPFYLHYWNARRQLTIIGSGLSDYLDPVLDPQYSSAILDALRAYLEWNSKWDVCDWQDLSAGTPLAALARAGADTPCCALVLGASFEEFLAARPHGLRRNLRRYRDKAEAIGTVRFQVAETAEPLLLDSLIDLHRARWRRSGEPGVIDLNGAADFIRAAATAMANARALRIFTIQFKDRVVAILLALRNHTTLFSYLSAFDPQYETFGFGRELLARAFEYAHENNYGYWNFLRGEEPYKMDWGAQLIPKCRLTIERSTRDRAEIDPADSIMAGHG